MSQIACQYAIVRFTPFVETGEFANVGILMLAPHARFFGFKLETRRYGRIIRFFDDLDRKLYREAVQQIRAELERVHEILKRRGFDERSTPQPIDVASTLFNEVIRARESIIRFSEPRVVLTDAPSQKLEELFEYYVNRSFVTKEYKETVLERGIRRWLAQENLADRFHRERVGDDGYHATFPFVEQIDRQPVRIIKPLSLAQESPSRIRDHGGTWLFRLDELKRRKALPEQVLVTVAEPDRATDAQREAYLEIVDRLDSAGVTVTDARDRASLLKFAGAPGI